MINQFLLFFFAITVYEFIRYFQLIHVVKLNLKIYQKILKLFRFKKVSDFRKEKLVFNYSKTLLFISIKIIIIIVSILIFTIILNFLSNSYLNFIKSTLGLIELSIIFFIYHLIRK